MTLFYKIALVLFILFFAFNMWAIDWHLNVLHPENSKFIFSAAASLLGVFAVIILNTWRKLSPKNR